MPISMHYFTVRTLVFLFFYLHCQKYRMRPTSKWEALLNEDLKKSAEVKKEYFIFWKSGQYRAKLISRIEFVS